MHCWAVPTKWSVLKTANAFLSERESMSSTKSVTFPCTVKTLTTYGAFAAGVYRGNCESAIPDFTLPATSGDVLVDETHTHQEGDNDTQQDSMDLMGLNFIPTELHVIYM